MPTVYLTEQGAVAHKHNERLIVRKGSETLLDLPLVHVDQVVELQWPAVLHERLQHRVVHPLGAQLGVRVAERAQVLHAGFLQVGQVAAVVHDAHRVRLGEADAQPVHVRVVGWVQRRIELQAHGRPPYMRPNS